MRFSCLTVFSVTSIIFSQGRALYFTVIMLEICVVSLMWEDHASLARITINTVNIKTSFHRTSTETEEDMLDMAIPNICGDRTKFTVESNTRRHVQPVIS